MKQFIYTSILLVVCYTAFGQASNSLNPQLDSYAPPSPNAGAIAKFGNIPVGQSTGIPQINVPLYSYSSKASGLQFSMSLDYHAGGIRVDEMSSNVGIGWALNAGGVISRNVRGIYDEMLDVGFINAPALPVNEGSGNCVNVSYNCPFNYMYANEADNQNDIFNFSFNGRSGKFMFGKQYNFLVLNQQKIKVEKELSSIIPGIPALYKVISKFILTDENGFIYTFDAPEITTNHSIGGLASKFTSSWYLTKILSPSRKDSIVLSYENTSYTYDVGRSESEAIYYPGYPGISIALPERINSASVSQQTISGKRLKTVNFPDGVTITCSYSTTERTGPTYGDFLLKKVTISHGINKRGYTLNHDYSLNRPTLLSVTPFAGATEIADAGYEFFYDIPLPNRLSNQQDHWGYYNNNTGSLIPREIIPISNYLGSLGNYHEIGSGDRRTALGRVNAGSLKKIKYPSGGYTEFEMEANQAVDPRLNKEITYSKQKFSRQGSATLYCTSSSNTVSTFDFQGDPGSSSEFTIKVPSTTFSCSGTCKVIVEIRNPSNVLIDIRQIDPPNSSYQPETKFTLGNLSRGIYKVTTYTQGLSNYYVYIDFRWTEVRLQYPIIESGVIGSNELFVGGLRAKRILDYDGTTPQPTLIREYEYTLEDGKSSGTLGYYPVYTTPVCYFSSTADGGQNTYNMHCTTPNFFSRSSSTVFPLAYSSGSPVAYKRVIEKTTNGTATLGKTVRFFKSFKEVPYILDKPYPFTPPEYKEWLNGLLDSVKVYNSNNTLLRMEINDYTNHLDNFWQDPTRFESLRSMSLAPVMYLYSPNQDSVYKPYWTYPRYFKAQNFYPTAGRAELTQTTVYEYDANGKFLATVTSNTYDPENLYLKKTEVSTSVPGTNNIQQHNYPKDMVSTGRDPLGVYQAMVNANIINPVVETIQLKGTKQIALSRKNYYSPYTNVFAPQEIMVQNGTAQIEPRIRYHDYSSSGRPLTLSKHSDVKQTYLWGYNNQLPVAHIVGADHTTASSLVDAAILNAPASDAQMRQELNKLRTGLQNVKALVTTYTYNPLYGITSMTDPNGRNTFNEYDGFGRLIVIRDHDNNIIKRYCYKYTNKPEICSGSGGQ